MENKHILFGFAFVVISFIAAYLFALTPTARGIPGFSLGLPQKEIRYETRRENTTYDDAQKASQDLGGSLATPRTPAEFTSLVHVLEDSGNADCLFITGFAYDEEASAYVSQDGEPFILFQYLDRGTEAFPGSCLALHIAPNDSSRWEFLPLPKNFGVRTEYLEKTAYIIQFTRK